MNEADIAILGAGAAGLMAAIWAARTAPSARVVALDGAARLGAKILVSGGGRCNVTHDQVDASAYAGSPRPAIGRVLRRFDVPDTVAFFDELGVPLQREETGKLFPISNLARTVLDALLGAARSAGVELVHPARVQAVTPCESGFVVSGGWGTLAVGRVILATGGRALPKSGSDGSGYGLAQALGHTLTPRIFPALVPLVLADGHPLRDLSGLSFDGTVTVVSATGKRLAEHTGAILCTHFGLSGPAILDISRHWLEARALDSGARLLVNFLPGTTPDALDESLRTLGRTFPATLLSQFLPDRLARALVQLAGIDARTSGSQLSRDSRRALVKAVTALPVPVTRDRGFTHAEVTAGGVPLSELRLDTMESRACPGLSLCGEICDVDGRIGGYNFQWAWASGYVAGCAAGNAISAGAGR